jgi:hypothetical protein
MIQIDGQCQVSICKAENELFFLGLETFLKRKPVKENTLTGFYFFSGQIF